MKTRLKFDTDIGQSEHTCRELKMGASDDNVGSDNHFKSHSFPNVVSKGTLVMVHQHTCNDPINTALRVDDTDDTKRHGDGVTTSGDASAKRVRHTG